jgi:hypothetical protein
MAVQFSAFYLSLRSKPLECFYGGCRDEHLLQRARARQSARALVNTFTLLSVERSRA